jgi:glycine oxidase
MTARVAVVGGGIVGLAVAWRCAQRGLGVTVYDPEPGAGASRVAAGMLAPASEAQTGEEQLQRLMLASARRWPDFAAELGEATGTDLGYRDEGTLLVALTDDDLWAVRHRCAFYARAGLPVYPMDSAELRDREPLLTPRVRGGAYAPGDHQVDPRRVVAALLAALRGVAVVRERLDGLDGLDADTVVLAAGEACRSLAGLDVRPVKGQSIRLRAPQPPLRHVVRGYAGNRHVYLVPRRDGELVIGATEEERGADTTVTAGGLLDLLRPAAELLPELVEYPLVEALAGMRPGTRDNAPLLGRLSGRVVAATGHYRHGILLTPVTADAIAELVATGVTPAEIAPFDPRREAPCR